MDRIRGKVAIVTGAARGQGEAHSRLFAAEGARVLMTDVLDDAGETVAEELRDAGYDVRYRHTDVTSEADWLATVEDAERRWGRIDILVNNAGIVGTMKAADEEDVEAWTKITAINQQGVFLGIKHVVPAMRRSGGGAIVNTCSINGSVGAPGSFSYQASKGAVRMMTRAAALEYVKDNIRVNSVSPGLVMTPMAEEEGEESNRAFAAATPMGRGARPEEVSYGVLFLASEEAGYITGTDLLIDGGYTAQ
ncbi:SDR family NAD(P)-dependent oxidoreductase [Streptomyces sp. NPDC127033]|uniref:SDR family NAD(P)-dependent oxidoreductase n=1 Tax=Streptomyces sp. NPDC127033 TaxID=3347110 RepID=UPI0036568C01